MIEPDLFRKIREMCTSVQETIICTMCSAHTERPLFLKQSSFHRKLEKYIFRSSHSEKAKGQDLWLFPTLTSVSRSPVASSVHPTTPTLDMGHVHTPVHDQSSPDITALLQQVMEVMSFLSAKGDALEARFNIFSCTLEDKLSVTPGPTTS